MIKTEKDYKEAKKRYEEEFRAIEEQIVKMKEVGLNDDQISLAIEPLMSFTVQLQEEVEEYENIRRGQFEPLENLSGMGKTLIALRIFKGLKQKDLAKALGVKETQVSRDERNEYHGASIEKARKVLEALGVRLKSEVDISYIDVI